MCEPRQKRLLAPAWMGKRFHHEQFSVNGVMGLIQQGAGHRHLRICEHRIPTCLLVLKPLEHTVAIGFPGCVPDVVDKVTQSLPQGKHA
jgi:hypothetical protein